MTSFCNLIGGALAKPPEVNGLNPSMLPGSFLPRADRGNEPGDEATVTAGVIQPCRCEPNSCAHEYNYVVRLPSACKEVLPYNYIHMHSSHFARIAAH